MELIGVKTPLIKPGDDLVEMILDSIGGDGLEDRDILVIASSAVSTALRRLREFDQVEPGTLAKGLAAESGLDEKFVEIIVQESDQVLAPGEECILTIKNGMLKINAGVDRSNVPPGTAVLLPEDPDGRAEELRDGLERRTGKRVGLIISDSHVNPLRLGTVGQALGGSGVREILDCRDREDLYGRGLQITLRGIGDQLASAAQLMMGESDEGIPAVIFRGAVFAFSEKFEGTEKISPEKCVYSKIIDYARDMKE